ncbi:unnamed protein product [Eruca vesicaria subsp. sativa]|uniref:Uncharacterized protein n=1 Tax=Eruca vesicaria subsp. sativa TaxID=29727 RepID=A0ABC8JLP0_ERUVS|nr:unnamed protein product [Eruca vesicaria subsp. sativa]
MVFIPVSTFPSPLCSTSLVCRGIAAGSGGSNQLQGCVLKSVARVCARLLWSVGEVMGGLDSSGSIAMEVDLRFDVMDLGQVHLGMLAGECLASLPMLSGLFSASFQLFLSAGDCIFRTSLLDLRI